MAAEFRVFLSAVTSELGLARDALAADLRSRDTLVRVQSDFRQEADSDTTLKKLHDYIRDCSAVMCLIGARSGAFSRDASVRDIRGLLYPMVILLRPPLRAAPVDLHRQSRLPARQAGAH